MNTKVPIFHRLFPFLVKRGYFFETPGRYHVSEFLDQNTVHFGSV